MGGALQIMFGIIGKRWENINDINRMFNEYWVRPLKVETPAKFIEVENGAYW